MWGNWNYPIAGGDVKGAVTSETSGRLNTEQVYNSEILFLGMYPRKVQTYVQAKICP